MEFKSIFYKKTDEPDLKPQEGYSRKECLLRIAPTGFMKGVCVGERDDGYLVEYWSVISGKQKIALCKKDNVILTQP